MLNRFDRNTCVEVSRFIYKEMENKIKQNDHEKAKELGALWDKFVRFCGHLESKDEVL